MSKPTEQDNIDYWNNLAKGTPFEGLGSVLRNVSAPITIPVTEPREDSWLKPILLQFIAEYHQGLNELAGHGTAIEQAEAAILSRLEEVIGEDEQTDFGSVMENIKHDKIGRGDRNAFRAEIRKRLGLREG